MKHFGIAALFSIAATLGAAPAAGAQSVLIQSCKLSSGVTVLHNGPCDELRPSARADDRPQAADTGPAPRAPMAGVEGLGLSREAFFTLLNGTVMAECDKPKSNVSCMAKTPDVCRKTMPQAAASCEKTLKGQVPAQIGSKEEGERWAKQYGVCVGNQFVVLAGSANLDATGCKTAAADDANDVGSSLMTSVRKARR